MFEKCIRCEHLGKDCMPNLCVLSIEEFNRWAIKLKAYRGITNAELSERSGVPKGTIDMHFSKKKNHCPDVNYSTFAPILCVLTGCLDMQCPKEKLDGKTETNDKIAQEKQKKIDILKDEVHTMQKIAEWRLKAIVVLSFALGITLVTIIIALLVDKFNPDIGFFWFGK